MPVQTLERFTRKHPIDRILFGSDSPWIDQTEDIEYLFSLPFLPQDAKEKIAGLNAARLIQLQKFSTCLKDRNCRFRGLLFPPNTQPSFCNRHMKRKRQTSKPYGSLLSIEVSQE
jgi:hypothetical protein